MFDVHYSEIGRGVDEVVFSSDNKLEVNRYRDAQVNELRNNGYYICSRSVAQDILRNEDGTSILVYTIKERPSDNIVEK